MAPSDSSPSARRAASAWSCASTRSTPSSFDVLERAAERDRGAVAHRRVLHAAGRRRERHRPRVERVRVDGAAPADERRVELLAELGPQPADRGAERPAEPLVAAGDEDVDVVARRRRSAPCPRPASRRPRGARRARARGRRAPSGRSGSRSSTARTRRRSPTSRRRRARRRARARARPGRPTRARAAPPRRSRARPAARDRPCSGARCRS